MYGDVGGNQIDEIGFPHYRNTNELTGKKYLKKSDSTRERDEEGSKMVENIFEEVIVREKKMKKARKWLRKDLKK